MQAERRVWYNTQMKVFDFDETILHGNSVRRFFGYCLVRLPYLVLYLPVQLVACLLYAVKILNKDRFLSVLESFVLFVPCKKKFIVRFWDKNFKHIKSWYLSQRSNEDVVISASPLYLVEEACHRLGVTCFATNYSPETFLSKSPHCWGSVKVDVYRQNFGDTPIEKFYTDSMSDLPLLEMAHEGYFVKGNSVSLLYLNGQKVQQP